VGEVSLSCSQKPHGHYKTEKAEVEGRPILLSQKKKTEVIDGHDENTAEEKEINPHPSLSQVSQLPFLPQLNRFPGPASPVMEIRHVEHHIEVIGALVDGHDLGVVSGNGGFTIFSWHADRP